MEIGLHKWFILSKNAETKQTRTNLKKLGCLFESFIGAMFLDFNKLAVQDEDDLFKNTFLSGPGFQIVQIFIERVFESHVDWMNLIQNDDNYKNILQVKIQKQFKVTPHYMEVEEHNAENGYHMGVYLCLGQPIFGLTHRQSVHCNIFKSYEEIHQYMSVHGKIFLFLGEGIHKIKKKAEQISCDEAIRLLNRF
jgi:dsRNA-specific ribonuclease